MTKFKWILIIFQVLLHTASWAQRTDLDINRQGNTGNQSVLEGNNTTGTENKKLTAHTTVVSKLKVFSLNKELDIDTLTVDSVLENFQVCNPVYKNSFSNSFLGNSGSAFISNIFILRPFSEWNPMFFLKTFSIYSLTPYNINYYQTNHPYTSINYTTSTREKDDQSIHLIHTQNVNEKLNWGIRYNLVSSKGSYPNQKNKINGLSNWIGYSGKRYSVYANFNLNKFKIRENGGIIDTGNVLLDQVSTNLTKALTTINYKHLFVSNKYKIGRSTFKVINDSVTKETFFPKIEISHTFQYISAARTYYDAEFKADYYPATFINTVLTHDTAYFSQVSNTFQLKLLEGEISAKNPGLIIEMGIENDAYFNFKEYILAPQNTYKTSTFIAGNFIRRKAAKYYYNFGTKLYYAGYRAGDLRVFGVLSKKFTHKNGKQSDISAEGESEFLKPGYFYENYFSNSYIWQNSFKSMGKNAVGLTYNYPGLLLKANANYTILNNFVYFDSAAVPLQYTKPITVATLIFTKNFNFNWVHLTNNVAIQSTNQKEILNLPLVSLNHSLYFEFDMFSKALHAQVGAEVYFTTDYYSYKYSTATSVFYTDYNVKTGNYPLINVFVNLKVKTALLFFKWEHVNAGTSVQYYSPVFGYPLNNFFFKFGVLWQFKN